MIPFLAYAQNEGNKDSTNVPAEKVENKAVPNDTVVNEDSVPVVNVQEDNSGTEALSIIISEKIKDITELNNTINQKSDSISLLLDSIQSLKGNYNNDIDSLNNVISSLIDEKKQLEEKTKALATVSNIIYKQCLLYPLERKYNKSFVDESVHAINSLGIRNNPKYKEVCNTYWDLLNGYSSYNQEVLDFLKSQYESFELKRWNIPDITKNGCKTELMNLRYYSLYKNKDVKPWKSITYLDKVIDDLLSILSGKQPLNEVNFKNLIDRVTPKM